MNENPYNILINNYNKWSSDDLIKRKVILQYNIEINTNPKDNLNETMNIILPIFTGFISGISVNELANSNSNSTKGFLIMLLIIICILLLVYIFLLFNNISCRKKRIKENAMFNLEIRIIDDVLKKRENDKRTNPTV